MTAILSSSHRLGVPSHLYRGSPTQVAEACRRQGLTCVQLTPNFPGLAFREPSHFTSERCRQAADPFHAAGLPIACLFAATNPMEPNLSRRHRNLLLLHALLRHARDFGTRFVLTETGNLNSHTSLQESPLNRSPVAWAELSLVLHEALRVAADHGTTLLLKAERGHLLASREGRSPTKPGNGYSPIGI